MKFLVTLYFLAIAGPQASAQLQPITLWKNKTGFFVMSNVFTKGNMSGIAGANTKCLADLGAATWRGKSEATLTAAKVRAFLCDATACNDFSANTYYAFAVAGNDSLGGAVFLTDATGLGPGDTANWSATTHFGATANYAWTGRAIGGSATLWPDTAMGTNGHCLGWTNTTGGQTATTGTINAANSFRWNDTVLGSCGSVLPILCIVDP
jgi:hypothetical protein